MYICIKTNRLAKHTILPKDFTIFQKKHSILNFIITLLNDGKSNSVIELANNPLYK